MVTIQVKIILVEIINNTKMFEYNYLNKVWTHFINLETAIFGYWSWATFL